ncbi:MAG: hypothetical protein ABFE07_22360 [Armatimonadia bacterium]
MSDEIEAASGEAGQGGRMRWGLLAAAWGLGLLARGLALLFAFGIGFAFFTQDWPPMATYLVYVPSSVACALVAGWVYPAHGVLAAAVPLLLPPDYGAPLGLLVAVAMWLARTAKRRLVVTVLAVIVAGLICVLPLLPVLEARQPEWSDTQPRVSRFITDEVLAQPVEIVWDKPNSGRVTGAFLASPGGIRFSAGQSGPRGREPSGGLWSRSAAVRMQQVNLTLPISSDLAHSSPALLASSGVLRPAFASRFTEHVGATWYARRGEYMAMYVPAPSKRFISLTFLPQ